MPDGATKLPAALAIAGEGALTLIGASLNKLVFLGDLAEPSTPYSGGVRFRRVSKPMRVELNGEPLDLRRVEHVRAAGGALSSG